MSINIEKVAPEYKERCERLNQEEREYYSKSMIRCKQYLHKDVPVKIGDVINVGNHITELACVTRLSKCFIFYRRLTHYRWESRFPLEVKEERRKYNDYMSIYEPHDVYYRDNHRFDSYYAIYVEKKE